MVHAIVAADALRSPAAFATAAAEALGADGVVIAALDDARLDLVASHGYSEARILAFAPLTVASDVPLGAAAREGRPVIVRSGHEGARRFTGLAAAGEEVRAEVSLSWPLVLDGRVAGVLGVSFDHAREVDELTERSVAALATLAAALLDRERVSRSHARERVRSAALARLAAELAGAGSAEAIIEVVSRAVRPVLEGHEAILGVVEHGHDHLRAVLAAATAGAISRQHERLAVSAPFPLCTAVERDQLVFCPDSPSAERRFAPGAAIRSLLSIRALAAVPLRAGDGTVIGSLEIGWPVDRALTSELVDLLDAVATLCARALERAGAVNAVSGPAPRTAALRELGRRLAAAGTRSEAALALISGLPPVIGAAAVNVGFPAADGSLDVMHDPALDPEQAARYGRQTSSDHLPLTDAILGSESVFVADARELRRRYPAAVNDMVPAGFQAAAAIPVVDHSGAPLAVFGAVWREPQAFGPEVRALMAAIAELCAATLQRLGATDTPVSGPVALPGEVPDALRASTTARGRRRGVAREVCLRSGRRPGRRGAHRGGEPIGGGEPLLPQQLVDARRPRGRASRQLARRRSDRCRGDARLALRRRAAHRDPAAPGLASVVDRAAGVRARRRRRHRARASLQRGVGAAAAGQRPWRGPLAPRRHAQP